MMNDLRPAIDREYADLTFTDDMRLDALRLMRQPERSPMKKPFALALSLLMLLTSAATGFAAGAHLPTIEDFIARLIPGNAWHDRVNVPVDAQAIVTPAKLRHTSLLADIEIPQIYLCEDKLYILARITPRDERALIYTESALPVTLDGQALRYFDLYNQSDMTLLKFAGFDLNPQSGRSGSQPRCDMAYLYHEGEIDPESKTLTLLTVYEWQDGLLPLGTEFTLQAGFILENSRTHELEWNVLFAQAPALRPAAQPE